MKRKITRKVQAGGLFIGGGAPVSIQSMLNVPVGDTDMAVQQLKDLETAGAEMVRFALRKVDEAEYIPLLKKNSPVPLCADIHFDYKIALAAIKNGVDKIRLNPGNIGGERNVKSVVSAARERHIPIRIGVNGGSIDRKKYPSHDARSLVDSALEHVKILEKNNFFDIVVSMKSSDLLLTIEANRIFSEKYDYPLHIGLTEAGYGDTCLVQSSLAIGHLLLEGIGDTIRVSMTGDPLLEVPAGRKILEAVNLRKPLLRIVACPTCGRKDTSVDLRFLAGEIEEMVIRDFSRILEEEGRALTVAVMGCEVNGPGEAKDADVGLACARRGNMILFAGGKKVKSLNIKNAVDEMKQAIADIIGT